MCFFINPYVSNVFLNIYEPIKVTEKIKPTFILITGM